MSNLGLKTVTTKTSTRSRKPLRSMTSDREEDDWLFFKNDFLNIGMLLILQHPTYVRSMSKGRACMYVCKPTTSCVHLCNFSKKK
jgi:hypothetical protein